MGSSSLGMSPITGENSGSKQDPSSLPAALTAEVNKADSLPTAITEEASVEGNGRLAEESPDEPSVGGSSNGAGSLHPASAGSKVSAVDITAAKDIGALCLQLFTRAQARMAAKEMIPGEELPESLLELIGKHQEQDPYCTRIARQALHPRWQPNLALAVTGPGWDNYTVKQFPGGIRDLLCIAHRLIVPAQTSLRIELLHQFHDYPTAGHWGARRNFDLL